MPTEQALPKDHPALSAFETYKHSDEFRNSFKWAADVQHRTGSMWAAFWAGYMAAQGPDAGKVTGLWLRREGDSTIVYVEKDDGKRYEAIREHWDGAFSHHISASGLAGLHKLDHIT